LGQKIFREIHFLSIDDKRLRPGKEI
jgi:hypothetical protein